MPEALILLLEDQPLIAWDVEEALAERGLRQVVTLRSQKQAMAWLESQDPDFVLLDLFLDDGDSRPILTHLNDRNVPFLVYTGSQQPVEWGDHLFSRCDWIEKPASPERLADIILSRIREC